MALDVFYKVDSEVYIYLNSLDVNPQETRGFGQGECLVINPFSAGISGRQIL